jgi:two-component system chemotaxis response regulator CheY
MIQVIVADEVLLDRKQLRSILEKIGLDVVSESSNGIHAFNEFRIFKPNIIFLGLHMPMMDGITCMRRIKDIYGEAKVVLIGDDEHRRQIFDGLESGADEYIMKPYNLTQIEKVIYKTIKESGRTISKT